MGKFEEQLLNLFHNRSLDNNQCQCLPKAELKTKNEPKRQPLVVAVWVRFGFQLGTIEFLIGGFTSITKKGAAISCLVGAETEK